jgi:hypothetical protein
MSEHEARRWLVRQLAWERRLDELRTSGPAQAEVEVVEVGVVDVAA